MRKTHGFCKKIAQKDKTFKNISYLCAELPSAAMCSGALVRNSTSQQAGNDEAATRAFDAWLSHNETWKTSAEDNVQLRSRQ